jgi:hypothetical protein
MYTVGIWDKPVKGPFKIKSNKGTYFQKAILVINYKKMASRHNFLTPNAFGTTDYSIKDVL